MAHTSTALRFLSFSLSTRASTTRSGRCCASISRIDNRSGHNNGERASLSVGANDEVYRSRGEARALVLGMRVRTKPFPSIKGPCFHPARSGDRPFDLVSNAGAMTLPHFAVQTAIHSTLGRCVLHADQTERERERRIVEVSLAQSAAVAATARERARRGSDLIALKIGTVLKEDMSDLPRLSVRSANSAFSRPRDLCIDDCE